MCPGDMLVSEHVHYWRLQVEGPDCDECQYSAIMGLAACTCGELLGPTAIERRLNATERLSGGEAMSGSYALTGLDDRALHPVAGLLRAYAAALEGEDAAP